MSPLLWSVLYLPLPDLSALRAILCTHAYYNALLSRWYHAFQISPSPAQIAFSQPHGIFKRHALPPSGLAGRKLRAIPFLGLLEVPLYHPLPADNSMDLTKMKKLSVLLDVLRVLFNLEKQLQHCHHEASNLACSLERPPGHCHG
jgi:hypothetical protein